MKGDLTSRTFSLAADYLEEFGWKQGDPGFSLGPRCLYGAIASAQTRLKTSDYTEVDKRLYTVLGTDEAANWNDAQGRTKEEVIAVLREAAEL